MQENTEFIDNMTNEFGQQPRLKFLFQLDFSKMDFPKFCHKC